MSKRFRLSRRSSGKMFSRGAQRVHPKNGLQQAVLRGGIRL